MLKRNIGNLKTRRHTFDIIGKQKHESGHVNVRNSVEFLLLQYSVYVLLSPYLCFILFLYLNSYVLEMMY